MKYLVFPAALLLSSAAFAQVTPPPEPSPPAMPAPETPPTGEMPAAPAAPTMPEPPAATAPAAPAAPTMAPMASNPPPAAPASYPRCSKTVTDSCVQNSARESDTKGGPPARKHKRRS
jgi:hypothetical protein